jgi:hypothetical protein
MNIITRHNSDQFSFGAIFILFLALGTLALLNSTACFAQSSDAQANTSTWQPPSMHSVKAKIMDWLEEQKADRSVRAKVEQIWAEPSPQSCEEELLARLAATFALIDPNAQKLLALCSQPRSSLILPAQQWLGDPHTPAFIADNMRLFYARWLVQQSLYEEARQQLSGLRPDDVVAPATMLFYQSVVYHKLLEKESGLEAIDRLLSGPPTSPRRYLQVARLMQDDLKDLEDDSLDHISRRMDDIRRRLDLGRAGPKVRKVEEGVIEALDKLINELEKQQQQQSAAAGSTLRPNKPAQDSVPMGGKGPGDVTKRNIGSESDWGNLPPQQREEALQQIGRDFPAHYRDVIEQYYKRLASEKNQ